MGLSLQPARLKRYGEIARLLAAAAGGVWLAFNILHSDRPGKSPR
ncbi:MAG: hypothetical protein WD227_00785 [Vicinamibacterales bacterium]